MFKKVSRGDAKARRKRQCQSFVNLGIVFSAQEPDLNYLKTSLLAAFLLRGFAPPRENLSRETREIVFQLNIEQKMADVTVLNDVAFAFNS